MNSDIITSPSSFSWQRLMAYTRFRHPAMRLYYIIVPLVSLTVGIITYILSRQSMEASIFASLLSSILGFLTYISPLTLAAKSNRTIETLVPATWQEKATYTVGTCFIVAPALLYIPYFLMNSVILPLLFGEAFSIEKAYGMLSDSTKWMLYYTGLCTAMLLISTCMFSVIRLKKNRVGMAVVWTIVAYIGQSILSAIVAIIFAVLNINYFSNIAETGEAPNFFEVSGLQISFIIIASVSLAISLTFIYLTVRHLRKSQF